MVVEFYGNCCIFKKTSITFNNTLLYIHSCIYTNLSHRIPAQSSGGPPPAWRRLETTPKLLPDLLEQFELPLYTTYSIVYLLETLVESFWVVFPMFKVSCLLLCQEARPLLTRRRFHIHASKEHTHWKHFTVKIASFNCYIHFSYDFAKFLFSQLCFLK